MSENNQGSANPESRSNNPESGPYGDSSSKTQPWWTANGKGASRESTSKYQQWWILGGTAVAFLIAVVISIAVVGAPLINLFSAVTGGTSVGSQAAISMPNISLPSVGLPSTGATGSANGATGLSLSAAQKAEGYVLSTDGLVAWRYMNVAETSALTCGSSESSSDPCSVRHLLAIGSTSCKNIDVLWAGDAAASMNSMSPDPTGAPVQFDSSNSTSDTVAQVSCEKA